MLVTLDQKYIDLHSRMLKGMHEKQRRLYMGTLAAELPYGGISALSKAFGYSRGCIQRGLAEVKSGETYSVGERNRAVGGGRKRIKEFHRRTIEHREDITDDEKERLADLPTLVEAILQNNCYGDPMSTRKWIRTTAKSISEEIKQLTGQIYSYSSIRKIVRSLHYSLQKNQKYDQVGKKHPKRHEQYDHIQDKIEEFLQSGDPVISIDTKAKEKLGDFIRQGREYRLVNDPLHVLDHDFAFLLKQLYEGVLDFPAELLQRKAIAVPYGVYCVNTNKAYVTLGVSSDTSEFAVDSILNWWKAHGRIDFWGKRRLLILTDGGGSNRASGILFKIALQQLSDYTGLEIHVCHYPPGKSKWNPIEHRLWSYISINWAAKPLKNLEVMQGYISNTTTEKGLVVDCAINYTIYMTEKEKDKARKEGIAVRGIDNRNDLWKDVLIERWSEDVDLQKWNYIIRSHAEAKRWVNYQPSCLAC